MFLVLYLTLSTHENFLFPHIIRLRWSNTLWFIYFPKGLASIKFSITILFMVLICFNLYILYLWVFFVVNNISRYSIIAHRTNKLQGNFYPYPLDISNKGLDILTISSTLTIISGNIWYWTSGSKNMVVR